MARRLVQLKLRLLSNALHASTAAQVSFLVSTTLAILVSIGTFVVLALFRGQSVSVDVTSVTFTVFVFGWPILPIFAFSLDSTLDPATLAIYPLRIRPLVVGLLAASAAGAWPLANLIGLLGVTIGLAHGLSGVLDRDGRGAAPGAVLHHAGPAGDNQHGRRSVPPRQGPRRLPGHPDLRVVRVLCPGGAQGGRRRQVQCCDAEGSGAVELAPSRQGAASHLTMGVSCRNRRERAKSMRRREGRRGSALGFHSGIASVSWLIIESLAHAC